MKAFFYLVLLVAGVFVWLTSENLPAVVASHFGAGGAANGFSDKGTYTMLMLALVVGMPLLFAASTLLVRALPPELINMPNKKYWLAPERRAATIDALASLLLQFGVVVAVFLCFMHWLVVRANSLQPPTLPESWFFTGLAVFGAATVIWVLLLYRRFGRGAH